VLEGSVRCNGTRVRSLASCYRNPRSNSLVVGPYDRDLRDALEVQMDVARQIGKAVAPELLAI